jgi:DNA polymerase, archaea type
MIICEYAIENEKPVIYTFDRDKNGKRIMKKDNSFNPYFYCKTEEENKLVNNKKVLNIEKVKYTDIEGNAISKIICKLPSDVKELKKEVNLTYEADIQYISRYMIDKYDIIDGQPLSVIYLDIETNSKKAFPNVTAAQDEITAITCYNNINNKCITFTWHPGENNRIKYEGKKSFKNADGSIFEYEDYTMFFDDERKMLNKFISYVKDIDADLFTGWNVEQFDIRYIINRLNTMGLKFQDLSPLKMAYTNDWGDVVIKGRIIFDMCEAVRKMNYGELDSYSLDNVALNELGEQKVSMPLDINGKEVTYSEFWLNHYNTFLEYNKKDVMLVYQIQKKKKIIQSFDEVRRMSKCSFNDVFNNSKVVDSFILSFCKNKFVLPSKEHHTKEDYGGGKVLKPKKGMYDWVQVFDFKALYPKIISSLNASPETITSEKTDNTINLSIPYIDSQHFEELIKGKKKFNSNNYDKARSIFDEFFENYWNLEKQEFSERIPPEIKSFISYKKVFFNQDKKGFIPTILEYLFNQRIEIQKERDKYEYGSPEYIRLEYKQYAFKILMNSFYGVLGHHGFRLYRPEIAASITFIGRNSILWSQKIAKENNYETLYGDTDSIFVVSNVKPINEGKEDEDLTPIIEEGEFITDFLQDSYENFTEIFNIKKHYLKIEYEKVFRRIFFGTAKKRYAGKLAWYKSKKADNVKITGFEVVRTDQSKIARKTQEYVFTELVNGNTNKDFIVSYIRGIEKNIKENKYTFEMLGIPTPLNKNLSEYKTNIPMVRAVSYSNRYLKLDIRAGEKFLLLYVKNIPGLPTTDVIAFRDNVDIPKNTLIDYQKHIDESTKDKMRSIFDGLGWNLIELTGQKSVLDY